MEGIHERYHPCYNVCNVQLIENVHIIAILIDMKRLHSKHKKIASPINGGYLQTSRVYAMNVCNI